MIDVLLSDVLSDFGYVVERGDHIADQGRIDDQMIDRLIQSDLVVCDLSDLNPNVMYELGIRHAIGLPAIVIASEGTRLPFDTASIRTIFYDLESASLTKEAERSLKEMATRIDDGQHGSNPVAERISRSDLEASSDSVDVAIARLGYQMDRTLVLLEERDQGLRDARFALGNQDYEEALRRFEEFLKEHPYHREGLIGLAKVQKRLNMPVDAIESLTMLLDRDSTISIALYNRACYKALAGYTLDDVLEDLSAAIELTGRYRSYATSDPDFAALASDPAFVEVVSRP